MRTLVRRFSFGVAALCCLILLRPGYICGQAPVNYTPGHSRVSSGLSFTYAHVQLWPYLRRGLSYLESPRPLLPPESVPPSYVHPDRNGYGAYGLTPGAYKDVQCSYSFFKNHTWGEILRSPRLYDLASQAFADLLLKNLQGYLRPGATDSEIFNVLQQAWNLGLNGYKSGRNVVFSRTRRAAEYAPPPLRFSSSLPSSFLLPPHE